MFLLLLVVMLDSCSSRRPVPDDEMPEPEIDPAALSITYLEEGVQLEKENKLVEAYEKYKLALTANPDNSDALKNKERLAPNMRRLSDIHYTAGMKFLKKGKRQSAQREFLEATRLWPENEKAARMLDSEKKTTAGLTGEYISHTLKSGESLSKLAKRYYGDLRKYTIIADFNQIDDPASAKAGQIIKIPKVKGLPFNEKSAEPSEREEKAEGKTVDAGAPVEASPSGEGAAEVEGGAPEPAEPSQTVAGEKSTPEEAADASVEEPVSAIDSYREAGTGYFNKNNFEMAITEFTKVLSVKADDKEAIDYLGKSHYNHAVALFGKKSFNEAKEHFALAKKYDPSCKNCDEYSSKCDAEYKDMHYKKGVAFYSQQKLKEAIGSWRLVEAVDPNYMDVQKHIGKAENLLKRLEEIKQE